MTHDHHNGHGHRHPHEHGRGHNHGGPDHLLSHFHGTGDNERSAEIGQLAASFLEGFRKAEDKPSYLRLAGVPTQMPGSDGRALHLVEARITADWQLGTASPGFATRELSWLPFPASMVAERETMTFVYVSLSERRDIDLIDFIARRFADKPA